MRIYKTGTFESAHRIKGHNKCGMLHGHSYRYEVWIETDKLTEDFNFVLDFHKISEYFNRLDHSNKVIEKSCELLVKDALDYFKKILPDAKITVRIWETPTAYAEDTA